jgi:fumarate reductase flavoprotein subunit
VSAGKIVKADTVPALAARLGIPADNLLGTLERYNEFVSHGSDDDYLKQPHSLRAVAEGPFYGFDIHLPMFGLTGAGVRIDHNACVMHRTGGPARLFASGSGTGACSAIYVGSGMRSPTRAPTRSRCRPQAAFALTGRVPD